MIHSDKISDQIGMTGYLKRRLTAINIPSEDDPVRCHGTEYLFGFTPTEFAVYGRTEKAIVYEVEIEPSVSLLLFDDGDGVVRSGISVADGVEG